MRGDRERWTTRRRAAFVSVLAGLLLVVLATPSAAQQGESVVGDLVDADGEPVAGVEITVRSSGDLVGTGVSDDEGKFVVAVPAAGVYEVELAQTTLPDGLTLRNPDQSVLSAVTVREGQTKRVLFPLGAGRSGISRAEEFATLALDGLRIGLILAVMSVGLSLVFGVTGLTNFAHGELVTFGALMAFLFSTSPVLGEVPLVVGAVGATVAGGMLGLALERGLFRPLRRLKTGNVSLIVVTIGLSLVLRHIYLVLFGERPAPYDDFTIQRGLDLPLVSPRVKDLVIMAVAAGALGVYGFLMARTRMGMATRAVSDSPDLAEASGIDVRSVIQSTWVLTGGLAALGGVLWGASETIQWDMGFTLLLLMFATVILGGIGTAYGPMVGGIVIGLASQISTFWIDPKFRTGIALAVLIVVILIRPQGILGRKERIG